MKNASLLFCCLIFSGSIVKAQKLIFKDSIIVESKIWSRDSNRNIQYSDWKKFPSHTIESIKGYTPLNQLKINKYGGDLNNKVIGAGFFTISTINGRSWIIDPEGNYFYNIAINGVRLGKSPDNEAAFAKKFGNSQKWITDSKKIFDDNGFNTTGSWSDIEAITQYNSNNKTPIVYCTQLSLLNSYAQNQKKNNSQSNYPILAYVFDDGFRNWCNKKNESLVKSSKDQNLFGHFSDNELPFQDNLIANFLEIKNQQDPAYQIVHKWILEKKIDTTKITKEQKEAFSGFVAELYYKTVAESIKKFDPNHLFIGSRLHAAAKNNPFVLTAAEIYCDIISINYYGNWELSSKHSQQWASLKKPFIITEFYTKAVDSKMDNITGAGWLVKTQDERGIHYQNFCLSLLQNPNCVGWHWFRYQDNDPNDPSADPSNKDANKGIVNTFYEVYNPLLSRMKSLNENVYQLIKYIDKK
jgi:hypothetical protein